MPIPFILAGIAIAAGAYGTKKGYDAYCDYDEAEKVNDKAKIIYDSKRDELSKERKETQFKLEKLGEKKFYIYKNLIIPFQDIFSKIKNLPDQIVINGKVGKLPTREEIHRMQEINFELKQIIGGGITALGAGGLAGLAAYGGVGTLATASSGTAIASLSGVAATNATLAWLGGGSIASGGFGIVGGTAILGGIVAGPVLAIGGMMLASKAEEAKENAYSNLKIAELAVAEMEFAKSKTNAIKRKIIEFLDILDRLSNNFQHYIVLLLGIVSKSIDFDEYTENDIKELQACYSHYETFLNLLEIDLLTANGELTVEIKRAIINNR